VEVGNLKVDQNRRRGKEQILSMNYPSTNTGRAGRQIGDGQYVTPSSRASSRSQRSSPKPVSNTQSQNALQN
jgi:hypothetical protein